MSETIRRIYQAERTTVEATDHLGDPIELRLIGTIDQPDPGTFLAPAFDQIHQEAAARPGCDVVLDVTQLTFLNSTGLKYVIQWVMRVVALAPAARYTLRIRSSQAITWQRSGLRPLTLLSQGVVAIEEV